MLQAIKSLFLSKIEFFSFFEFVNETIESFFLRIELFIFSWL